MKEKSAAPRPGSSFPRWALAIVLPLGLLSLALVVLSALLLARVPVPVLPPLATASQLTTGDVVALLAAAFTSFLAIATVILAAYTREAVAVGMAEIDIAQTTLVEAQRQVRVAQDQVVAIEKQAAVAQAILEASWRPILIDAGFDDNRKYLDIYDAQKRLTIIAPLRNAGNGLAIITGLSLEADTQTAVGQLSASIVASGETVWLTFDMTADTLDSGFDRTDRIVNAVRTGQPILATTSYTDQEGRSRWISKAHISASQARNPEPLALHNPAGGFVPRG